MWKMRTLDAIFARALSDEHRLACTTSTISAFEGFCAHMSRLHCVVVSSREPAQRSLTCMNSDTSLFYVQPPSSAVDQASPPSLDTTAARTSNRRPHDRLGGVLPPTPGSLDVTSRLRPVWRGATGATVAGLMLKAKKGPK